jgi:hypothetical protein
MHEDSLRQKGIESPQEEGAEAEELFGANLTWRWNWEEEEVAKENQCCRSRGKIHFCEIGQSQHFRKSDH